jgi:diacylglycerol kinase (ATP)
MLIAVANGRSYGGGMLVCPNANITDGLFDVMVLHPVSTIEFMKVFPRVFAGSHISHPAVEIIRSRNVTIEAKAVAYADGERIGQLPITAECISGALKTWVA